MKIDVQKILNQSIAVTQEEGSKSKYPRLLYPSDGTVIFKPLYNVASSMILRPIRRHSVNDIKVPCLQMYGEECKTCNIINEIQTMKGLDLWNFGSKFRALCYIEFIKADYKWDGNPPKTGDIMLLMVPWSVYKDMNKLIADSGENVSKLIAENNAPVWKITRSLSASNQVEYSVMISPFEQHRSRNTDAEFEEMMNSIGPLAEAFVPERMSDEMIQTHNELYMKLKEMYLGASYTQPSMAQPLQPMAPMPTAPVPQAQMPVPQVTQAVPVPAQVPQSYVPPVQPPPMVPQSVVPPTVPAQQFSQTYQQIPVAQSASQPYQQVPVTQTQIPSPAPIANNFQVPVAPPPAPQYQQAPMSQPAVPQQIQSPVPGAPECFSKHSTSDMHKCLACSFEVQCMEAEKTRV